MVTPDPIRARRARMAALARAGKRGGYTLFLVAIVAFVVGAATSFPRALVQVVIWSLAIGSVLLAPAIVVAYGVKAAEREDRAR